MRAGKLLWLGCAALAGCAYHVDKAPADLGAVPQYSKGQLSFALVSQYVFGPKCAACHGTAGGVSVESYAAVKQNLSRIEHAALVTRSMPRAPYRLTEAEARLLADWIAAGAPEQASGGEPPPPPPPPLAPTFASIHDRIFAKRCLSCHNPQGEAKGVPLDTAADLLNSPDDLVVPGDPEGSYLFLLVSPGARKPMPPPSSGMSPLGAEELHVLKEWIKNGAKD